MSSNTSIDMPPNPGTPSEQVHQEPYRSKSQLDKASFHTSTTVSPCENPQPCQDEHASIRLGDQAYGPASKEEERTDAFEVKMPAGDPANPNSWSHAYRWYITVLSGIMLLNA